MENDTWRMSHGECRMENVTWRMTHGECHMEKCRMENVTWKMSQEKISCMSLTGTLQ